MKRSSQKLVDAGQRELWKWREIAGREGYLFVPYSEEENFTENTGAKAGSLFKTRSSFNGGAHPNLALYADNFDYTRG